MVQLRMTKIGSFLTCNIFNPTKFNFFLKMTTKNRGVASPVHRSFAVSRILYPEGPSPLIYAAYPLAQTGRLQALVYMALQPARFA